MAAEMRPTNVTVTPINVEPPPPPPPSAAPIEEDADVATVATTPSAVVADYFAAMPNGLDRDREHQDSGSDAEVAQIDFESSVVNLRAKKKRDSCSAEAPRPMSWEGELSDGNGGSEAPPGHGSGPGGGPSVDEDDDMCIDEDHAPENLSLAHNRPAYHHHHHHHHHHQAPPTHTSPVLRLKQQQQQQQQQQLPGSNCFSSLHSTPSNSPLLSQRHATSAPGPLVLNSKGGGALNVPPTPSPDSAIHSAYSVFSSPNQSPLTQRHALTLTPSLSRNNSDASHSSCCSYSSVSVSVSPTQQFSPNHSPIQGRHVQQMHSGSPLHHNVIYRNIQEASDHCAIYPRAPHSQAAEDLLSEHDSSPACLDDVEDKTGLPHSALPTGPGISRQQLINSPCPICGDKISGFHYGIFSCESCKGFFKRTVQNRKNYVCLRGAHCPVTVATRKKCPACRFDKCLQCGMKLEAIREDRTRGGRSTYQCSYTLPASLVNHPELRGAGGGGGALGGDAPHHHHHHHHHHGLTVKLEPLDQQAMLLGGSSSSAGGGVGGGGGGGGSLLAKQRLPLAPASPKLGIPALLQEIMDVEHLWHYNEAELTKLSNGGLLGSKEATPPGGNGGGASPGVSLSTHPLLANTGLATTADSNPDFAANLCNIADHRLYKIVKWCKSLPLFKNISIDDQISLLINSWCELLLFSCCFRSMATPGEIRVSLGKSINLEQARKMGLQLCIERMLNFTEHLRRLRVDRYEYVAMKVIVLLTSDTSELREAEKVRASQEKALQALQGYTLTHYPDIPAKFGELLLRIPELQRTCQVGKEMLTIKSKEGEEPSFNLLMELLRGDH